MGSLPLPACLRAAAAAEGAQQQLCVHCQPGETFTSACLLHQVASRPRGQQSDPLHAEKVRQWLARLHGAACLPCRRHQEAADCTTAQLSILNHSAAQVCISRPWPAVASCKRSSVSDQHQCQDSLLSCLQVAAGLSSMTMWIQVPMAASKQHLSQQQPRQPPVSSDAAQHSGAPPPTGEPCSPPPLPHLSRRLGAVHHWCALAITLLVAPVHQLLSIVPRVGSPSSLASAAPCS